MKTLLSVFAFAFIATQAQANVVVPLKCASKKNETLYYTSGQLLLSVKHVFNDTTITGTSLSLQPEGKLGAKVDGQVTGKASRDGKWTRFDIGGDAWCSYRLTLPRGFSERFDTIPAFVDAFCEENSNYSIRLNCRIQ